MKLEGKQRLVFNPATGKEEVNTYPATRAEAFREGLARYQPLGVKGCKPCGDLYHQSLIYTVSDLKVCCARALAKEYFDRAKFNGEPLNASVAAERGLDYYWVLDHGKYCGHAGKLTLAGKCWLCSQSPRKDADAAGAKWYTPKVGDECKRCGTLAPRRITNGACSGCEAVGRPERAPTVAARPLPYHKQWPDQVLTYDEAKLWGFKIYRTGEPCRAGHRAWRYVSTRNCLECMGR